MRYYMAGMIQRGERANTLARKGKKKIDTAALSQTHHSPLISPFFVSA